MCGIAGGWLNSGFPSDPLRAALDRLVHRGPDDGGTYLDGPVGIGMRRLAIIDIAGGRQPISNEDDSIWVVFNGEIYNYRELADELQQKGHRFRTVSDTEVLVHLYEELGTEMCVRLRGMFAFAIYDARHGSLFLARDRFGKKPLYYRHCPGAGLVFASELKALHPLAAAAGKPSSINSQAIYDFLSLGYVPQPETAFHDTWAVPPASWVQFDGNHVRKATYWQLNYSDKQTIPYPEALERVQNLISDAVRVRLRSDVSIGVFLSGGVDSSVVAWEAAQLVGASLQTFTVSTDDPSLNEADVAQRTAARLGVQNTVLPMVISPEDDLLRIVRQYDQPFADSSALPTMAISRLARQHITVVLTGDGGDEVFCGYRRYLAARAAGRMQWLPRSLADAASRAISGPARSRRSVTGFMSRFLRAATMPIGQRYIAYGSDMLGELEKKQCWLGAPMRPTEVWIESTIEAGLGSLDELLCGDHRINLLSDMLVKVDIATMAGSVEARSPLLDHRLAEFVVGLPDRQRLHRWQRKSLLRDAYRNRLPAEVIDGRKRGFEIPMRRWLGAELRPLVCDLLEAPDSRIGEYVDRRFVLDVIQNRAAQQRNWMYLVYGFLVLELWLREISAELSRAAAPCHV
ncbi:MAG TPA: asparagine synthase (glutamine-hydrolyzing) [Pirellulales bacterium]|jgi:asparagine synthase (glutamine-hydrolysing)